MRNKAVVIAVTFYLLLLFMPPLGGSAGEVTAPSRTEKAAAAPGPANRQAGPPPALHGEKDATRALYGVTAVVLLVWAGLGLYLFRIDRRVSSLEKRFLER
jgi:CcmD family protein